MSTASNDTALVHTHCSLVLLLNSELFSQGTDGAAAQFRKPSGHIVSSSIPLLLGDSGALTDHSDTRDHNQHRQARPHHGLFTTI